MDKYFLGNLDKCYLVGDIEFVIVVSKKYESVLSTKIEIAFSVKIWLTEIEKDSPILFGYTKIVQQLRPMFCR